ncbi:small multi-drug export protein [Aquibacillus sediminis]|uniref:small multi-drug export protein n=1 Tax=Aquibacillus sediminis TaxID=2574734 RepID=UPI001FE5117B|nr:small multi-drug export protein [Aquibacillus sediminis]
MMLSYLSVFLVAATPLLELIVVIPVAIVGGLSPVPVALMAFAGNAITVFLLIVFIDRVKQWIRSRKKKRATAVETEPVSTTNTELVQEEFTFEEDSKKAKRARHMFDKYGLPGLALIGPFIIGSHISGFMAMSFGANRRTVMSWMLISLALWTVITAVATMYGATLFI